MIRRILAVVIVITIAAGIVATGYALVKRSTNYPEGQGSLHLVSGSGMISAVGAAPIEIKESQTHSVKAGETVKVSGTATLTLAGITIDLVPGTELEVRQANALGNEGQTELILKSGQLLQRISGYTSARSTYSVTAANATLTTGGGEFLTRMSADNTVQFVSNLGTATIRSGSKIVLLKNKQGLTVQPNGDVSDAIAWSVIHLQTYRPDGSQIALPAVLINENNKQDYKLTTNSPYLVPEGVYTLRLLTLAPYEIQHVSVLATDDNILPITLGETIFTVTDERGNPQAYTALNVKGSEQIQVLPDASLLLGPGTSSLIVARTDRADELQPIEVSVAPGERAITAIPENLFGGGRIRIDLGNLNGTPVDPVAVAVYTANNENGDPIANFRSDGTSPLLPTGDYIVSVKTQLAGRYLVTVPKNQTVTVAAPMSYIDIIYTDNQGKPVNRNAFIYIASVAEITRLGLPVDQMRRTPYGIGLPLAATNRILVPVGTYNIMIDDRKDVVAENVEVKAGQITPVELQALPG